MKFLNSFGKKQVHKPSNFNSVFDVLSFDDQNSEDESFSYKFTTASSVAKIYQEIDILKKTSQTKLDHVLYGDVQFVEGLYKLKSSLKIPFEVNIDRSFLNGRNGAFQEQQFQEGVDKLQAEFFQRRPDLQLEFGVEMAKIDLQAAVKLFNIDLVQKSWDILKITYHYFSQISGISVEGKNCLNTCLELLHLIWQKEVIKFEVGHLQDLSWYCLNTGLYDDATTIFKLLLQSKITNAWDVSSIWANLGKALSYLPNADSGNVEEMFEKSIEHAQKLLDPTQRLIKTAETNIEKSIALLNLGKTSDAETHLEKARNDMLVGLNNSPDAVAREASSLYFADNANCHIRVLIEKMRQSGFLSQSDYIKATSLIKEALTRYVSIGNQEMVEQIFDLADDFERLCPNQFISSSIRSIVLSFARDDNRRGHIDPRLNALRYNMGV